MIVKIDKTFERDVNKVYDKPLRRKIAFIIEQVLASTTLDKVSNVKKLKGNGNYFRIRVGDYRIGIEQIKEEIHFVRFLHRKEMYRFFP